MERIHNFLSTWILQPEECQYEAGQPPVRGIYKISEQDGKLLFHMIWTDVDGQDFEVTYSEHPDGEEHPYKNKQVADSIRLTPKSDTILESEAFKDNILSMRATRELLDDDTMRVTFEGMLPEGQAYYNISFYKRSDEIKAPDA